MFLERSLYRSLRPPALGAPVWALGVVFVLGLAVGSLIPARGYLPPPSSSWNSSSARPAPTTNPQFPDAVPPAAPMMWSREGHPGVRHAVEVMRVVDGDTFEARVQLWPGLDMTTRVRLRGIDAPETKGACADEARMAEAASDALRALLADGDVAIFNIGPDKYNGRVVADAATRRTSSVSNALLTSGHARRYEGGRRGGWCAAAAR